MFTTLVLNGEFLKNLNKLISNNSRSSSDFTIFHDILKISDHLKISGLELSINSTDLTQNNLPSFSVKCMDRWHFLDCVIFSAVVITTIGYGSQQPQTGTGQVFLIVYSVIGIPFMMVFVYYWTKWISNFNSNKVTKWFDSLQKSGSFLSDPLIGLENSDTKTCGSINCVNLVDDSEFGSDSDRDFQKVRQKTKPVENRPKKVKLQPQKSWYQKKSYTSI